MSDLISRKALIKEILDEFTQERVMGTFLRIVENLQTAYDLEKVVDRLQEEYEEA